MKVILPDLQDSLWGKVFVLFKKSKEVMLHTNFFNTEKNKTEIFYFFFYFLIVVMAVQCGLIVITPVHHIVYEMLPSASKLEGWAIAEIVCATLSILLYQLIYRLVGGYNERKKVAPGWVIVLLGCTYGAIVRQESWYDGWDPTNVALILWVLFLWFCVFAIILFTSHQ